MSSDDLRGKIVLIDFWATWCGPCVTATPGLARIQKKYKDEPVVILGISADRDRAPWKEFIEKHKLDWTHFYDDRGMMANAFRDRSISHLHRHGSRRHRPIPSRGLDSQLDAQIDDQIRSLMKKAKAAQSNSRSGICR